MRAELKLLSITEETLAEFIRECVGVREQPIASAANRREIKASAWAQTLDDKSTFVGRVVFAVAVSKDGASTAIAMHGLRPDGASVVDVIDAAAGTDWVQARLAGLIAKHNPVAVGVDSSVAAEVINPEIERICKAARTPFVKLTMKAYAAGCADFVDAVNKRRVFHLGQAWLNLGVAAGRRRSYGDVWVWDTRLSGDVVALVAVTVARRVFTELPAASKGRSVYEDDDLAVA